MLASNCSPASFKASSDGTAASTNTQENRTMDYSQASDAALLEALSPQRESNAALDEYMRRQEGRIARQRDITRLVLEVVTLPVVAVVDLEATCYGSPEESANHAKEVIEVGWALMEPATGRVLESEQFYVRPTTSFVSSFCTELTGIRPEQVEHAESFAQVMERVRALHERHGVKLWGSYGDYDRKQLETQCANEGVAYPWEGQKHFNIKEFAGAFFGFGKKSPGLARALERAGLAFEGRHHSGVDDARNTARLLAHMLGRNA
ncbi:3'-5' exonuclease [Paraburkholderia sp. UCT31]|uniref:3'-5' exonuclease n=1 Tax=Paraburkholderia sp. UCT31 TaxID=2615209 RepID=UPI0016568129|nr:3'-5' exonuclease [Paraburkholderia sp. UCT31]